MRLLVVIALLLGSVGACKALSYGTPNSIAAQAMASNMNDLREAGREVPKTWEAMDVHFARPVDEVFPYVLPTRRYAFVTNEVRVSDSRLLLVMRSPFRDIRRYMAWYGGIGHGVKERGRWVILQDSKSVIRARYMAEDVVAAAFARAGVPLPIPDGSGEWRHETEYRQSRNIKIVISSVILTVVFATSFNRTRRRTMRSTE